MHLDDGGHGLGIGKLDVVEEAAAQERIRQLLLVVRGDDDDRPVAGGDCLARLVDVELHAIELLQEVVRELDVGLVDLVDEQDRAPLHLERVPELAAADVVADVLDSLVAELPVAQTRDRVVLVKTLLGLGRRFDVPLDDGCAKRLRNLERELSFARARLTFDEEGPLERDRGVDGDLEIVGRHIAPRPVKLPCRRLGHRFLILHRLGAGH